MVRYRRYYIWDGAHDEDPSVVKNRSPVDSRIKASLKARVVVIEDRDLALKCETGDSGPHNFATPSIPSGTSRLPSLPLEIQLRIVGFAMKMSNPIIDPFYRSDPRHLAKSGKRYERAPLQLLQVCTAFLPEGMRSFISSNKFVFTQPAALENFRNIALEYRSLVCEITLRVIGRYYDDHESYEFDVDSDPRAVKPTMKTIQRFPSGAVRWRGLQSYCWRQIIDFLSALVLPSSGTLFPMLRDMKFDLINFIRDLPEPGVSLRDAARVTAGKIVDNLHVTGLPEPLNTLDLAYCSLRGLVKDGGCYASSGPEFATIGESLETLQPDDLQFELVSFRDGNAEFGLARKAERFVLYKRSSFFQPSSEEVLKFHIASGTCLDCGESETEFDIEDEDFTQSDMEHWHMPDCAFEMENSEGGYLSD